MRLNLVGNTIEQDIAELQRFIEEWKTPQFTSQDSGMLANIARSFLRDQYGDIVELSGDIGTGATSQIALPATPSPSHLNSIYATQIFVPAHNKPAVAVPLIKFKVDSGGLHGESELFVNGQWGITMPIYNASNVEVGRLGVNQALGGLFKPIYHDTYEYAWETQINYTSTVPFALSYEFYVRSSDAGGTSSELVGYFF
jgi:hypothetical protein